MCFPKPTSLLSILQTFLELVPQDQQKKIFLYLFKKNSDFPYFSSQIWGIFHFFQNAQKEPNWWKEQLWKKRVTGQKKNAQFAVSHPIWQPCAPGQPSLRSQQLFQSVTTPAWMATPVQEKCTNDNKIVTDHSGE